jgi:hypothetical protein
MFIARRTSPGPRSSGAQFGRATFGSAGAETNFSGRDYKHLVPPGLKQIDLCGLKQNSNNTPLPHYLLNLVQDDGVLYVRRKNR